MDLLETNLYSNRFSDCNKCEFCKAASYKGQSPVGFDFFLSEKSDKITILFLTSSPMSFHQSNFRETFLLPIREEVLEFKKLNPRIEIIFGHILPVSYSTNSSHKKELEICFEENTEKIISEINPDFIFSFGKSLSHFLGSYKSSSTEDLEYFCFNSFIDNFPIPVISFPHPKTYLFLGDETYIAKRNEILQMLNIILHLLLQGQKL